MNNNSGIAILILISLATNRSGMATDVLFNANIIEHVFARTGHVNVASCCAVDFPVMQLLVS